MTTTFMASEKLLFTSESVTEGHPDKLCDQISDAVLDAIIAQDSDARVACETATTTGLIVVMGEPLSCRGSTISEERDRSAACGCVHQWRQRSRS